MKNSQTILIISNHINYRIMISISRSSISSIPSFLLYFILISSYLITVFSLSKSKLSIHVNTPAIDNTFLNWLNATQPRVLKLLDPPPHSDILIKNIVPDIILIGRIYTPTQPVNIDPKLAAQLWFNNSLPIILNNTHIDYWEGYNEIYTQDLPTMTWYTAMEIERTILLASINQKISIGQFSSGCPDVTNATIINAWLPAIATAVQYKGILGLHEYSSPTLLGCYSNSTHDGWLTVRYRKLYNEYLLPNNLLIPIIISESGIDNSPCSSPNLGGWMNYCSYWSQLNPPLPGPTDCGQQYVYQLSWYDSNLLQDNYILGTTIFCYQCAGFASYEVKSILDDLQQYMNNL